MLVLRFSSTCPNRDPPIAEDSCKFLNDIISFVKPWGETLVNLWP